MTAYPTSTPLVLVADVDAELRSTVAGFMAARGYEVRPAEDVSTAMSLLATRNVDVLISDLASHSGGLELLSFARESAPATRSIALAGATTAHDRDHALRLGAIRVLFKPLSLLELADAVGLARDCGAGFHGQMHRMTLIDVLQMYHHAGESLTVRIRGAVEGELSLQRGELIHAECGAASGAPALVALLGLERGHLETTAMLHDRRTLEGPFDHVLLDGLRALDERRRLTVAAGPALDLDGWELEEPSPLAPPVLRQWLADHAPGAALWSISRDGTSLDRVDVPGEDPQLEPAGALGSIGWALELAELGDPTWTRVELTNGVTAVALIRVADVMLAFARLVTGAAMQHRFHAEAARLASWLAAHLAEVG